MKYKRNKKTLSSRLKETIKNKNSLYIFFLFFCILIYSLNTYILHQKNIHILSPQNKSLNKQQNNIKLNNINKLNQQQHHDDYIYNIKLNNNNDNILKESYNHLHNNFNIHHPKKIGIVPTFLRNSNIKFKPKTNNIEKEEKEHIVIKQYEENQENNINNNIKNNKLNNNNNIQIYNQNNKIRALIFTMDSTTKYIENAKHGGPAGEITIRKALQDGFDYYNIKYDIAENDQKFEFLAKNINFYDIIILDPWTWAKKGWKPKDFLIGQEEKIYLLDFFGSPSLNNNNNWKISSKKFLTAFPTTLQWNTYLGYYINEDRLATNDMIKNKKNQGIIWGKDEKQVKPNIKLLNNILNYKNIKVHSSIKTNLIKHNNIYWHGHLEKNKWHQLLAESKFVIGMGHPLLGPSAIDAIVAGAVYINPLYDEPIKNVYYSQHPYLEKYIGMPYVCSAHLNKWNEVQKCIDHSLNVTLTPIIPKELKKEEYLKRVYNIFKKNIH